VAWIQDDDFNDKCKYFWRERKKKLFFNRFFDLFACRFTRISSVGTPWMKKLLGMCYIICKIDLMYCTLIWEKRGMRGA
jgi:hypothetical protein